MSSNPVKRASEPMSEDVQQEANVDAYVARNRDALNASIRRSRQEVAEDISDPRSMNEIIVDGRKRRSGGS